MKHIRKIYLIISFAILSVGLYAQPPGGGRMDDGPGMRPPERIEHFKKMRMIEVLKLSEEESVRFFAKQSGHEQKIRELMKERNVALDDIEDALDSKSTKDLQKLSDKILEVDEKIFRERQRFQGEIQKFLTTEQFANYLLFEREFGKQMRGAMEDMVKGKKDRWRKDDND